MDALVQISAVVKRHESDGRPAVDRLNMSDAWCEALFASGLQPSDGPAAGAVAEAVRSTIRQFGVGGCVGRMAQEFGDHPEAAVERMRWVRRLDRRGAAGRRGDSR